MSDKIGVLGSGTVAQILAAGLTRHGYQVKMGTRDPAKLKDFLTKEPTITAGSFADAAAFGQIAVLAVKGTAARQVIDQAGVKNLAGKVVIDPTNPIEEAKPEKGVLKFFSNINRSLMEDLQAAAPEAHFVKAFSMIGGPLMVNPDFGNTKPTMFICGNNADAKARVRKILDQFGFETEDMGDAESARAIEPLCMLWCIPGLRGGSWSHAFKLLKK
ncbi:MAG: NAD(P)-binding domain-containing protein [Leptospirales bacterium]|nr:NAD(P)-binding domain-containing protein [Leptospirales bacterium]